MRVAVALVAGQAALCAVIGWVTFGPSGSEPEPEPQAAGPTLSDRIVFTTPPTIPPPVVAAPPPRASASKAPSSPRASKSTTSPTTRATSKQVTEEPQPNIAPAEDAPVPPEPDPGVAATLPPSSIAPVQSPAVEDESCDPEGAEGLTSDGVELRCVLDAGGELVWQII